MSITFCDECECFVDTDLDPDSCVDDKILCETCREDIIVDAYIHETDKYKADLINKLTGENKILRKENQTYRTALENIAFAKSWTVQNKPMELVSMALLGLGKL